MKKKFDLLQWEIARTPASDRANLFARTPTSAHHLATILSGSRSQLSRFDASLELITAAPKLTQLLGRTSDVFREYRFVQAARVQQLDREITELLERLAKVVESNIE